MLIFKQVFFSSDKFVLIEQTIPVITFSFVRGAVFCQFRSEPFHIFVAIVRLVVLVVDGKQGQAGSILRFRFFHVIIFRDNVEGITFSVAMVLRSIQQNATFGTAIGRPEVNDAGVVVLEAFQQLRRGDGIYFLVVFQMAYFEAVLYEYYILLPVRLDVFVTTVEAGCVGNETAGNQKGKEQKEG